MTDPRRSTADEGIRDISVTTDWDPPAEEPGTKETDSSERSPRGLATTDIARRIGDRYGIDGLARRARNLATIDIRRLGPGFALRIANRYGAGDLIVRSRRQHQPDHEKDPPQAPFNPLEEHGGPGDAWFDQGAPGLQYLDGVDPETPAGNDPVATATAETPTTVRQHSSGETTRDDRLETKPRRWSSAADGAHTPAVRPTTARTEPADARKDDAGSPRSPTRRESPASTRETGQTGGRTATNAKADGTRTAAIERDVADQSATGQSSTRSVAVPWRPRTAATNQRVQLRATETGVPIRTTVSTKAPPESAPGRQDSRQSQAAGQPLDDTEGSVGQWTGDADASPRAAEILRGPNAMAVSSPPTDPAESDGDESAMEPSSTAPRLSVDRSDPQRPEPENAASSMDPAPRSSDGTAPGSVNRSSPDSVVPENSPALETPPVAASETAISEGVSDGAADATWDHARRKQTTASTVDHSPASSPTLGPSVLVSTAPVVDYQSRSGVGGTDPAAVSMNGPRHANGASVQPPSHNRSSTTSADQTAASFDQSSGGRQLRAATDGPRVTSPNVLDVTAGTARRVSSQAPQTHRSGDSPHPGGVAALDGTTDSRPLPVGREHTGAPAGGSAPSATDPTGPAAAGADTPMTASNPGVDPDGTRPTQDSSATGQPPANAILSTGLGTSEPHPATRSHPSTPDHGGSPPGVQDQRTSIEAGSMPAASKSTPGTVRSVVATTADTGADVNGHRPQDDHENQPAAGGSPVAHGPGDDVISRSPIQFTSPPRAGMDLRTNAVARRTATVVSQRQSVPGGSYRSESADPASRDTPKTTTIERSTPLASGGMEPSSGSANAVANATVSNVTRRETYPSLGVTGIAWTAEDQRPARHTESDRADTDSGHALPGTRAGVDERRRSASPTGSHQSVLDDSPAQPAMTRSSLGRRTRSIAVTDVGGRPDLNRAATESLEVDTPTASSAVLKDSPSTAVDTHPGLAPEQPVQRGSDVGASVHTPDQRTPRPADTDGTRTSPTSESARQFAVAVASRREPGLDSSSDGPGTPVDSGSGSAGQRFDVESSGAVSERVVQSSAGERRASPGTTDTESATVPSTTTKPPGRWNATADRSRRPTGDDESRSRAFEANVAADAPTTMSGGQSIAAPAAKMMSQMDKYKIRKREGSEDDVSSVEMNTSAERPSFVYRTPIRNATDGPRAGPADGGDAASSVIDDGSSARQASPGRLRQRETADRAPREPGPGGSHHQADAKGVDSPRGTQRAQETPATDDSAGPTRAGGAGPSRREDGLSPASDRPAQNRDLHTDSGRARPEQQDSGQTERRRIDEQFPLSGEMPQYEADVDRIVDRLYRKLERKQRIERERRGGR